MAFTNGQSGKATINSTDLHVENWTLTENCEALDSTTTGDSGWETNIAGVSNWEGSIKTYYDGSITYYSGALALIPGTQVSLVLNIGSTGDKYQGNARVTSAQTENPAKGIVPITFNYKGNGALTRTGN